MHQKKNRWVLLEHKILTGNLVDIHYDFLVEDQLDCLTWKMYEIPSVNTGFVDIGKQANHRLIWLSRVEYILSNNRGLVKRIDNGTFINGSEKSDSQEFKFILDGNLLDGLLTIVGSFCQLSKYN